MRTASLLATVLAALGLVICGAQPAQADEKEYFVKAAFIFNFVKFTQWPGDWETSQTKRVDICAVGSSPFGKAASVFKEASTPALTLNLVEEPDVRKVASHCHIAFIRAEDSGRIPEILAQLSGSRVLTVSDAEGFANKGGMIGFVLNDNKIRLVVNMKAATAAGLQIDAQLLEIAFSVIR